MTDQTNPPAEDFRSQVQRLVAEGKLSAEDAAGLLEGVEHTPAQYLAVPEYVQEGETPPNLKLDISGFTLQVILDSRVTQPELHANEDGKVMLQATPQGWRVCRRPEHQLIGWSSLKAILALPFTPQNVRADVDGGNLTLPDISGDMQADVNGGNIRMGQAASLKADINGGNLTASEMHGPTKLTVNGGNISLSGAQALNASVNGGNLKWAGFLTDGQHRLEVNAGNATLHLHPGSSVTVQADVTVGGFKADFPTQKSGGFLNTHHSGQLGGGQAQLNCRVAAGQIRVISE